MKNSIIIVEKDRSLKLLYQTILKDLKLKNQFVFFECANEALNHISKAIEKPFLIISNYDLPRMKGLDLKKKLVNNPALRQLVIPFILIGDKPSREIINRAHELGIDGFFDRNTNYDNLKFNFKTIIDNYLEQPAPDIWLTPKQPTHIFQYQ
ncbi:MAG: response regulator [Bacteroidia bacterium]